MMKGKMVSEIFLWCRPNDFTVTSAANHEMCDLLL